MKYYKIVDCSSGGYRSYNLDKEARFFHDERFSLEYKIGEWTHPLIENSKLFAFDTLDNALSFLDRCDIDSIIFECEVKNPARHDGEIPAFPSIDLSQEFWKHPKKKYGSRIFGTVLCDAIKIVGEPVQC
jgi:hypothetical protein